MNVNAWQAMGDLVDISATTTGGSNRQALDGEDVLDNQDLNVRVVNGGAVNAIVAFGDVTVDASTDTRAVEVAPGERVFKLPQGATYADAIMRSGTGTVSVQVGYGV